MSTLNTTPNRGYQEPFLGNDLSVDVGRLISALRAIDVDVANALAAIVAKASLASPVFTGVPTALTAAPGTDTGQLATTAFVRAAVVALIAASPAALDTLNELAAALGNDPNFSTTVLTAIGLKADAAATTAALALKEPVTVYATKAANYTALATDNNAVHTYTATATVALTAAATLASGWHYTAIANGAAITIDPDGAELINAAATLSVPDKHSCFIVCTGSAFVAVVTPIAPALPTRQVFTSGSGTYTTPANCRQIIVRMVGGGGGGAGSGTSPGAVSSSTASTFGTFSATGGGAASGASAGVGSLPASGAPAIAGASGGNGSGATNSPGGIGGSSPFGGGGANGAAGGGVGFPAKSNTGAGGGGAGCSATVNSGGGGSAGGYLEAFISSPGATYSYSVGASGTGGTAGTGGAAGGNGGSGLIIVDEFYQ